MIQQVCRQHQQPLNLLCLDNQCEKIVVCCECLQKEEHKNVTNIPSFLFKLRLDERENASLLISYATIDQLLHTIKNLINSAAIFQDAIKIRSAFSEFANKLKKQLLHIRSELIRLPSLESTTQLKQWVKQNMFLCLLEIKEATIFQLYVTDKLQSLRKIEKTIYQIIHVKREADSEIIALFSFDKNLTKKLHFVYHLKPPHMQILNQQTLVVKTSSLKRMALIDPPLQKFGIQKWKIKILKMASWIGVGVSHLTKILEAEFQFVYTTAHHGNYLMSSNGYLWNGYEMDKNSKQIGTTFKSGDVISMEYDAYHHTISIQKEGCGDKHTLNIDPEQTPLHASVNITSVGDQVEIVR